MTASAVVSPKKGVSLLGIIAYFSGDYLELDSASVFEAGFLRSFVSGGSFLRSRPQERFVLDEV